MLDRHHLAIIIEVERQGSLTAAAESLCLTQSALSHSVKKLEQQLGTEIWLREKRHLRLTQAGEYLLTCAQRMLPQFEHAESVIRQFAKGERGDLRIGMECHPCYRWLLKIVEPFLQQWPDVNIDVKQQFTFGGVDALVHYEIDLLVTPDPVVHKELEFFPVFDYEQVLVVHPDHPLCKKKSVSPTHLADETIITYPVEAGRLDIFNLFLMPANIQPGHHKTVEATDIMLQLVAAGRGVAALPRWLVDEYSQAMPLRTLRLGKNGIKKQIHLGLRVGEKQIDYLQGFLQFAKLNTS